MEQQRLDAIRARCEAASNGPWFKRRYAVEDWNGNQVCGDFVHDEDKTFIPHAREDIPYLLAEVERLRVELEAAKRDMKCRDLCDICKHNITHDCDLDCAHCEMDCKCRDCRDENLFEWRGLCAENQSGGSTDMVGEAHD